jgi:hypothetical protein
MQGRNEKGRFLPTEEKCQCYECQANRFYAGRGEKPVKALFLVHKKGNPCMCNRCVGIRRYKRDRKCGNLVVCAENVGFVKTG